MLPLVSFMYCARILSADGMGKLNYTNSISQYFILIGMLGIENYGVRIVAKHRDNSVERSRAVCEIFYINLMSIVSSIAIYLALILSLSVFSDYRLLLIIYGIQIPIRMIAAEWIFTGIEEFKYVAVRTVIFQIFSFLCILIFIHNKGDIYKYALIQVICLIFVAILNIRHLRIFIQPKPEYFKINTDHIRPIIIIFLMNLSAQVFTHLDSTMIGLMIGDSAVGLYSAGIRMSGMVGALITSISLVSSPEIAYYSSVSDMDNIKTLVRDITQVIMLLSIPAVIGLLFMSPQIISVFCGEGYIDAINCTRIVSTRALLVPLNMFIGAHILISLGRENIYLGATCCAAIFNFVANLFLIRMMGYTGAAITTVLAETIELIIMVIFLNREFALKEMISGGSVYALGGFFVGCLCFTVQRFIENNLACLFLGVVLSIITYFAILVLFKNPYVMKVAKQIRNKSNRKPTNTNRN